MRKYKLERGIAAVCWLAASGLVFCLLALGPARLGLFGLVTSAFAGLNIARFRVGFGATGEGIDFKEAVEGLIGKFSMAALLGTVFAIGAVSLVTGRWPGGLYEIQLVAFVVGMPVTVLLTAWGVIRVDRELARWLATREGWVNILSSVFGLSTKVVLDEAKFHETRGGLVVTKVPEGMALALLNPAALEAKIARIRRDLMLDKASDENSIWLVPVDAETAAQRRALAESGGLWGAVIEDEENLPAQPSPGLVITAEDLGL